MIANTSVLPAREGQMVSKPVSGRVEDPVHVQPSCKSNSVPVSYINARHRRKRGNGNQISTDNNDQDCLSQIQSDLSHTSYASNSSPITSQSLSMQFHRTRLCPYYTKGYCRKESNCTYAHDLSELKSAPDLYKTKLCDEWQKGICNDINCRFAHGRHELRCTNLVYKTRICHFWTEGQCNKGNLCRHAHGLDELRGDDTHISKMPLCATKSENSPRLIDSLETVSSSNDTHPILSMDKDRIAKTFKSEHQMAALDDYIKDIPKFSEYSSVSLDMYHNHQKEVVTFDNRNSVTSKASALLVLNEAFSALNLKGDAAAQAAKLQALIPDSVIKDGPQTPNTQSSSFSLSVPQCTGFRRNEWGCASTDVESIVSSNEKETLENTTHYSCASSLCDSSPNHNLSAELGTEISLERDGAIDLDDWLFGNSNRTGNVAFCTSESHFCRVAREEYTQCFQDEPGSITLSSILQKQLLNHRVLAECQRPNLSLSEKHSNCNTPLSVIPGSGEVISAVDQLCLRPLSLDFLPSERDWDDVLQLLMKVQ